MISRCLGNTICSHQRLADCLPIAKTDESLVNQIIFTQSFKINLLLSNQWLILMRHQDFDLSDNGFSKLTGIGVIQFGCLFSVNCNHAMFDNDSDWLISALIKHNCIRKLAGNDFPTGWYAALDRDCFASPANDGIASDQLIVFINIFNHPAARFRQIVNVDNRAVGRPARLIFSHHGLTWHPSFDRRYLNLGKAIGNTAAIVFGNPRSIAALIGYLIFKSQPNETDLLLNLLDLTVRQFDIDRSRNRCMTIRIIFINHPQNVCYANLQQLLTGL